jgi:hypothetical protein
MPQGRRVLEIRYVREVEAHGRLWGVFALSLSCGHTQELHLLKGSKPVRRLCRCWECTKAKEPKPVKWSRAPGLASRGKDEWRSGGYTIAYGADRKFSLHYGPDRLGQFATKQGAERAAVEHHSVLRPGAGAAKPPPAENESPWPEGTFMAKLICAASAPQPRPVAPEAGLGGD